MGMWTLVIGLLLLGLISPMIYNVAVSTEGSFSDPSVQIITAAFPALIFFVFIIGWLFLSEDS